MAYKVYQKNKKTGVTYVYETSSVGTRIRSSLVTNRSVLVSWIQKRVR